MKRAAKLCLMAFFLFLSPPFAAAEKERPSPDRLNDFTATGIMQNCVSRIRIDDIEVLNDYVILFHMTDKKVYKNELPHRCFRLGSEKRFAFRLSSSLLCDDDIIRVFSTGSFEASCGLGEFEELEEIEEAAAPGPGNLFNHRS